MNGISVLTIVRNREAHLHQLIEGLHRSARQPDELIIVDMSDEPVTIGASHFPVTVERFATDALPLAAARNRAAVRARYDRLVFLDVDCIPMSDCIGRLAGELDRRDGLLCADIRYLGPDDARTTWTEAELLASGRPHSARNFPADGAREEANPGLFWSLAFAIRKTRFEDLGGFDERFEGYGAEDTDFGFRSAKAGLPLLFVGGAIACHQHHESYEPPFQHVRDIVRNAQLFHDRWGRWPMEGWLEAFDAIGLVEWRSDTLSIRRLPTSDELTASRVAWSA
jgi:GT2 family glycosyltransferase